MRTVRFLLIKLFSAKGLVAVFGALIAGFVLLIIFVPEEQPATNNQQPTATPDEIKQKLAALSTDSDNDGLKDWEEPLYKTDPKNPDTDGDGTNDGEEIKQNRDPLKKGPNDAASEPQKIPETETEIGPNLTAELMNVFIRGGVVEYLARGGDPNALPEELYGNLQTIIGRPAFVSPQPVSLSELTVIADSSERAITTYFNALAAIYRQFLSPLPKDDMELFLEILESEDATRLAELDRYIQAIDQSVRAAKQIPAPQILASAIHKKELDMLLQARAEIAVLRNADKDPLAALTVLPERVKTKKAYALFHTQEMPEWVNAHIGGSANK